MNNKSKIGQLGEDIASEYLKTKGYKIIERNFRRPWGELDIIAKDKEGVLVFIEVKTMRQYGNGSANSPQDTAILPEENLTSAKLRKLQRTAGLYVGYNSNLVDDNLGWRIDLVAISLSLDFFQKILRENVSLNKLTNIEKYCEIKYFENIN